MLYQAHKLFRNCLMITNKTVMTFFANDEILENEQIQENARSSGCVYEIQIY